MISSNDCQQLFIRWHLKTFTRCSGNLRPQTHHRRSRALRRDKDNKNISLHHL